MEDKTKSDKKRQLSAAKEARNLAIRAEAAAGKTATELAKDYGLARQTVSGILNSEQTAELLRNSEDRVKRLIGKSIDRLEAALEDPADSTNGLRAALAVLKNFGLLRDTVEMNHNFPRPVVIERLDGCEIVLGTSADVKAP